MNAKATILLPTAAKILAQLGEDIKLARLRRNLSTEQVAERANISRTTLWLIEKGTPSVAMGGILASTIYIGFRKKLSKPSQ